MQPSHVSRSFFFNDTATTEIYTLSLHDALPIYASAAIPVKISPTATAALNTPLIPRKAWTAPTEFELYSMLRSEEHTSELQSQSNLVCRLLLEKKKHQLSPPRYSDNRSCPAPSL